MLVSNDREFLRGLVDKVYESKNKTVKEYAGGIDFFLEQRKISQLNDLNEIKSKSRKVQKESRNNNTSIKELDLLIKKTGNRVNVAERKVNELDEKKEALEQEMNKPESASNLDLFSEFNRLENELFSKIQEWENATDELEKLKKNKIKLLRS